MMNEQEAFEKWWAEVSLVNYLGNFEVRMFKGMTKDMCLSVWQAALASISQAPVAESQQAERIAELETALNDIIKHLLISDNIGKVYTIAKQALQGEQE
jgi:hypothetical protein